MHERLTEDIDHCFESSELIERPFSSTIRMFARERSHANATTKILLGIQNTFPEKSINSEKVPSLAAFQVVHSHGQRTWSSPNVSHPDADHPSI